MTHRVARRHGRRAGALLGAGAVALTLAACAGDADGLRRASEASPDTGSGAERTAPATSGAGTPSTGVPGEGTPGNGGPGEPTGTELPADRPDSSGDAGRPLPQDRIVDQGPSPSSDRKLAWVLDNGRTVRVVGVEGGCSKSSARVTGQNAERVRISVIERIPTDPDQLCTMDIRYPKLTVRLDEPLGERTVVIHRDEKRVPRINGN